jgi:hypothetical protein
MSYHTSVCFKILNKNKISKKMMDLFMDFRIKFNEYDECSLNELLYDSTREEDGFSWTSFEELRWGQDYIDGFKSLSHAFPTVRFAIKGFGEESEDIWIEYYQNGFVQEEQAKIVYPRFNPFYFRTRLNK